MSDTSFKIAVIATAFYLRSHADVICTRWTEHRPGDTHWGWDGPSSQIAAIHIEQMLDNDIGRKWATDHHVPLMDSVEKALTLGTDRIAVDGVILIGEHGDYPLNELGQKMYPRKRLFDEIVKVYRKYGKSLPIFNDKHYSYDHGWAQEMFQTSQDMGFTLLGGSSIPHTPTNPKWDVPGGFNARRCVAVYYGGEESYLYHSIEFAQSMLEKRKGGETGIAAVTTYQGKDAWPVLEKQFGMELVNEAASAARIIKEGSMFENTAKYDAKSEARVSPILTIHHYADGMDVAHLNLNGHIEGWTLAMQDDQGKIHKAGSTEADGDLWYAHFATLSKLIETYLKTRVYPFAPQRALLTTCATSASMHSYNKPGVRYESPEAMIAYQPLAQDAIYHPGRK